MQSWRPARPASLPSEQTDRQTPGRGTGDDSWSGGVPAHVVAPAAIRHQWLEGGQGGSWEQGTGTRSCAWRGFLEGFAHWRLNHLAFAELRWWLLSTQATDRDDFYAHPQRGHFFLLLRAQQSALTCSSSPSGYRFPSFHMPFSPARWKCHPFSRAQGPSFHGRPGGLFPLIVQWAGSRRSIRLSLRPCRNYPVRCEEWRWWGRSTEC